MSPRALRVVVADDERPARAFLVDLLRSCDAVHVAGWAERRRPGRIGSLRESGRRGSPPADSRRTAASKNNHQAETVAL